MPMLATQPSKKTKTTLKTELGLKISTLPSFKIAEEIALMREKHDDLKTRVLGRCNDLLRQMRSDEQTTIKVRTAGGSLFRFEIANLGEKVKISKPAN